MRYLVLGVMVLTVAAIVVAIPNLDEEEAAPAQPPTGGRRTASAESPAAPTASLPSKAHLRRACKLPEAWVRWIDNGWDPSPSRAADLVVVPDPPNYVGTATNTSHSGPYGFLQRVPLIFRGPGHIARLGHLQPDRQVTLADLAPTYARLLGFHFPAREGRAISEIVTGDRPPLKLIVTVSIDGGGWNVLNHWPGVWPNLRGLIDQGVNIDGAVVGSSPSITPASHTNMMTGAFPRKHGVTAIAVRAPDGTIQGAYSSDDNYTGPIVDPGLNLRVTTLGDLWDQATNNAAKVGLMASGNYPLGLLGHGAQLRGGDKDTAGFLNEEEVEWGTDKRWFSLPASLDADVAPPADLLEKADRADGRADGRWLGHDLDEISLGSTPALAPWVVRSTETVVEQEGFGQDDVTDLLYVHLKSPDHAGHVWNMISPEARDMVASVDDAIGSLVAWLDGRFGKSAYVLTVTADHGQTPLEVGGWTINRPELLADVQRRFDHVKDSQGIIQRTSATSFFANRQEMRKNGVSPGNVASFLSTYTIRDNVPAADPVPEEFAARSKEKIFSAVFPGQDLARIVECSGVSEE
ncbi:MAG: alkaline phosphatase family protein [Actinobacteria bacterium]|nr:alkaline phosphatase family protein [Actinomycetota bacterium]